MALSRHPEGANEYLLKPVSTKALFDHLGLDERARVTAGARRVAMDYAPGGMLPAMSVGLDYVSCSPYRVPIARLAAAHSALGVQMTKRALQVNIDASDVFSAIDLENRNQVITFATDEAAACAAIADADLIIEAVFEKRDGVLQVTALGPIGARRGARGVRDVELLVRAVPESAGCGAAGLRRSLHLRNKSCINPAAGHHVPAQEQGDQLIVHAG